MEICSGYNVSIQINKNRDDINISDDIVLYYICIIYVYTFRDIIKLKLLQNFELYLKK